MVLVVQMVTVTDGDGGNLQLELIKYKQCFRPYHERKASTCCGDSSSFFLLNLMDI